VHESQLHQLLREHPELIEPGLRFIDQEVPMGQRLRCDLLYEDTNGRKVYVEVKWTAGKSAVIQVEQYEVVRELDRGGSRFILAAVDAKAGIPELLARRGFEFKRIDRESILALRPEWQARMRRREGASVRIPREIKDVRVKILQTLCEALQTEFPDIKFDRGPESRYRLIMPWDGKDYFLFDFSSQVKDGLRCAFVVDLDEKESWRRQSFRDTLRDMYEEVASTLGSPVVDNVSNRNLVQEGLRSWTKISHHRRMGVHCFYRLPEIDWSDTASVVESLVPYVRRFVKGMNSLLRRYKPPTSF